MARVTSRLAKVRARLDLPTVRRASGLLEGRHRSIYTGHGQDFDEMAEYQFGDDVGDIDWKASASYGLPVIRRFVRDSNLAMVIAVDTGRNMAATAPAGEPKSQIAMFAAEVVCFLARGRGDTVALVAGDADRLVQVPARGGTEHMEMLLRRVEGMLDLEAPASDLRRVMDRVLTWFNRRSLVVLITDEARPQPEHEMALKRLRTRHEVMVIQVGDAVPTAFGDAPIDDVDTHLEIPEYMRSDKKLAEEARRVAEQRRQDVHDLLRRQDVQGVVASSEDEFVAALIDLLRRQRRVHR
ncbi:MAG TPA: DUF58 domain-containing protein [Ruania sp.]|nr:DUF58 domain-containing protein [Ruania sp.]